MTAVGMAAPPLRIGTRGSALAMAQANLLREALEAAGTRAQLDVIVTAGDRRAPDTAWGEGAFVSAIEEALVSGRIDVAVHSAKDVPTEEDVRLTVVAYLPRADPADVIVLAPGQAIGSLADLAHGARVGTDSPRRTAFLRAARQDLRIHAIHGNVDTRLRRLDGGETDALVLAAAGLERLGLGGRVNLRLDPDVVPPAPGQGALAIQVRADDGRTRELVAPLDHPATRRAVEAERALLATSGGGCRAPLGALGRVDADGLELTGGYARASGGLAVTVRHHAADGDDAGLVARLLADLATNVAERATVLGGPRVIVTRAADQAAPMLLALVDRGLVPLAVPAIEIQPATDGGLDRAVNRLGTFAWVVVTSSNAADALRAAARRQGVMLASGRQGPRWAVVGSSTDRALRAAGVTPDLRPARSSGAALAAALPLEGGERILLPRSDQADDDLPGRLRARGADPESVIAYLTIEAPASSRLPLRSALETPPAAILFTSGSTVRGLLALADDVGAGDAVRRIPVICIGPGTAAVAVDRGFTVVAAAVMQGPGGIADAAAAALHATQEIR